MIKSSYLIETFLVELVLSRFFAIKNLSKSI